MYFHREEAEWCRSLKCYLIKKGQQWRGAAAGWLQGQKGPAAGVDSHGKWEWSLTPPLVSPVSPSASVLPSVKWEWSFRSVARSNLLVFCGTWNRKRTTGLHRFTKRNPKCNIIAFVILKMWAWIFTVNLSWVKCIFFCQGDVAFFFYDSYSVIHESTFCTNTRRHKWVIDISPEWHSSSPLPNSVKISYLSCIFF